MSQSVTAALGAQRAESIQAEGYSHGWEGGGGRGLGGRGSWERYQRVLRYLISRNVTVQRDRSRVENTGEGEFAERGMFQADSNTVSLHGVARASTVHLTT